jgi:CRP-like cAMP-binding protein
MAYDLILQNIAKHITLTTAETNHFISLLKLEAIKKKTILLREGQLCNNIYYVSSGILRAYHLDKDGKEATIMFALSDWWITDMFCFVNQQPAMLFIEAVENSTIVALQKKDLDNLFVEVPRFERFFRIIMQNAYIREQVRVIQNLSLSAEERYQHFLNKYPQIVKQVTQKQIASYLGITPEFLSSVRGKKAKKNLNLS